MPTRLVDENGDPIKADDQDTFGVVVAFTDTDGSAATPNAGLTWTLTDEQGNVINERQDVAITPASTVTIVLFGDDLKFSDAVDRVVTVEGTYNSSTLGDNRPLKRQVLFSIEDPVAVVAG